MFGKLEREKDRRTFCLRESVPIDKSSLSSILASVATMAALLI